MRLGRFSFKLKEEFDRVNILHWGHLFFLFLATLTEFFKGELGFFIVFKISLIAGYYYFFTKIKRNLHYSFWTFSVFLAFYFLGKMFQSSFGEGLFIFYSAALMILGVEMYILYSPIYYPIVSWWEYDFRYRDDLKIHIKLDKKIYDGRLTDLRRNAGCVASFEEIPLGRQLHITPFDEWGAFDLQCEIMSCRQYSLGRPYHYGVRFFFEKNEDQHLFFKFCKFWKNERQGKMKRKFTHQKSA